MGKKITRDELAKLTGRKSKYGISSKASRTTDGIVFHSKKEMEYYQDLCLRRENKDDPLAYFLRQVRFDLPGGVKYYVDFMEVITRPFGEVAVYYVDVKGFPTPLFKAKKKLVEALYPIKIEVV